MHVGMEEAVADGVAQEALDDRVAERHQIEARLPQCFDIRHAACHRSTRWSGRAARLSAQSTVGRRKPGSSLVFSAISAMAEASMRRSSSSFIDCSSIATAAMGRRRLPSADMLSIMPRGKAEAVDIGSETLLDTGAQNFDCNSAAIMGHRLVHLCHRGGGNRGH